MATGAEEVENTKRPIILLIPYPAQGHITPMLLLAHSLHSHGLHPILAVPDFIHRRIHPSTGIHLLSIPSGLTDTPNPDFFSIDRAMEHHMPPHLDHILRTYSPISCVIVDLLASWAIPITSQANIPTAGFWPAMNATYQLISAIPDLLRRGLISDCGTPLCCVITQEQHVVMSRNHLPWMVGSPSCQVLRFEFWVRAMKRASSLRWLLTNSFSGEGEPARILPVRPALNREANRRFGANESCLEWLDSQRPGSVVYVAFGTWVGPIGKSKIAELALGLEATCRPFLWVLRDEGGWREGLPEGYLKRVAAEGRGKVVAWAPQEAVLGHAAVGCYVTHCGWNSTMEAVCHGKRMVCYPIAGDQFVNCDYVVREWGVGLLLEEMERESVREVVERVMEGEEGELVEKRMRVLRERVVGKEGVERAERKLKLFVDEVKKGVH